jgi:hypothetical protein
MWTCGWEVSTPVLTRGGGGGSGAYGDERADGAEDVEELGEAVRALVIGGEREDEEGVREGGVDEAPHGGRARDGLVERACESPFVGYEERACKTKRAMEDVGGRCLP